MAVKDFRHAMNGIDVKVLRQVLASRLEVLNSQLRTISSVNRNLIKTKFNVTRSSEKLPEDIIDTEKSDDFKQKTLL